MADVYAIGLQEVVDLNAVNVARDRNSQARIYKAQNPVRNFKETYVVVESRLVTNIDLVPKRLIYDARKRTTQ